MKFLSIDSLEESYAVCEDENGEKHILNYEVLPKNISEGDIIKKSENKWTINQKLTMQKRNEIINLRKKIYQKTEKN